MNSKGVWFTSSFDGRFWQYRIDGIYSGYVFFCWDGTIDSGFPGHVSDMKFHSKKEATSRIEKEFE